MGLWLPLQTHSQQSVGTHVQEKRVVCTHAGSMPCSQETPSCLDQCFVFLDHLLTHLLTWVTSKHLSSAVTVVSLPLGPTLYEVSLFTDIIFKKTLFFECEIKLSTRRPAETGEKHTTLLHPSSFILLLFAFSNGGGKSSTSITFLRWERRWWFLPCVSWEDSWSKRIAGEMHRKDKRKFRGVDRKHLHCSPKKNFIHFPRCSHRMADALKTEFNIVWYERRHKQAGLGTDSLRSKAGFERLTRPWEGLGVRVIGDAVPPGEGGLELEPQSASNTVGKEGGMWSRGATAGPLPQFTASPKPQCSISK